MNKLKTRLYLLVNLMETTENQQLIINTCQYYSEANPAEGEIVLVQFTEQNETFFRAKLMEYDYTGMMNYQDVTKKRRVASWKKYVQLNKNMVARVDSVDTDKNIVQLSLAYLDEGANSKEEKSASQIQEKLMNYFNENKQMESFIKSLCIVNGYKYDEIWTNFVHYLDSQRREYNDENEENLTIWKYFTNNIDSLDEWFDDISSQNNDLDWDGLKQSIQALYDKKTEESIHKIVSKIGIISLGGISSTKELLKKVLDSINYKYSFRYDSTPYYILESSSEDSTDVDHKNVVATLEKESSKFEPKIFIKTEYIGKTLN